MSSEEFDLSDLSDSSDQDENLDLTDESSDEMSGEGEELDFFAQLALEEEGILPEELEITPPPSITQNSQPFPAARPSTTQTFPTARPPTTQSFPVAKQLTPQSFPVARQLAPQSFPVARQLAPQSFPVARPRITLQVSSSQPTTTTLQFPEVVTSGGQSLQQIVMPPRLIVTGAVSDIIGQDPTEGEQRWQFRQKYTLRVEKIVRNISNYFPPEKMIEFGVPAEQIISMGNMSVEQIISIGRAKTNKLYERVSYLSETEQIIGIINKIERL
uniref:Uncharacterized protein n=1 Tax=Pithovirus LCPAC201 TaxID=2506591 RepID=A0A481Z4M8_9VIRU|nr:MAG: hypothetical protein LCPAC201_01050 [Pithovirus LCPAC201]